MAIYNGSSNDPFSRSVALRKRLSDIRDKEFPNTIPTHLRKTPIVFQQHSPCAGLAFGFRKTDQKLLAEKRKQEKNWQIADSLRGKRK